MALAEDSSSITLSWKNSTDSDLTTFKITPYINGTAQDVISLSKADSATNGINFTASAENTYTYSLTSSQTSQTYKFTITAYDDAGNPTSLEGDDNAKYIVNFETSDSETSITVAGDSNPPEKAGDLTITIKSIADSTVTYDASWTNPSDSDGAKILINGTAVSGTSVQAATVSLSDISSGFTVSSVDTAGNENTITVPAELFKNVALNSSVTDEAHFSKALLISGISIDSSSSESTDYSTVYSVSAIKSDDTEKTIVSTAYVSSGKAVLRGLDCDTKYSLVAGATYTSSDYTVSFIDTDSDAIACSNVAKLDVAEIRQNWKKPLVVPYLTSSVTRTNVIGVGSYQDSTYNYQESDMTYTRWLIEPSFTNPTATDEYSFEAAQITSEGFVASGYFMYLDVKGETSWSSSDKAISSWNLSSDADTSKALRFALLSSMDDDKKTEASFKEGESIFSGDTSYGTWKVLKITYNDIDYGIFVNNFNMFATSSITASDGDYNLAVKLTEYTGTSSDVEQETPSEATISSITNTSAVISWTDPSNASLSSITVTVADSSGNTVATGTVDVGTQTYNISGLTKGTTYTVTLTATNIFGTQALSSSKEFTTSSMEAVSDIVIDMFSGTVSWAIPSDDDDFTKVTVKVGDSDAVTVNKSDDTNTQATVSGLVAGATVTVTTYATVDSEEKSLETVITLPSSDSFASASSATVENHLSGYKVTGLTLPSSSSSNATYAVAALEDGEIVSSSAYFTSETSTFLLSGLTAGKTYTVVASTKITGDDYTVIYTESTGTTSSVAAKTVVWELHSPWQGNGVITPYMTSSKTYQNVVQAGYTDTNFSNIENFTYNAWIVQPALNGDEDSFSLEATVANTGASSGYYMTSGVYTKYTARDWNITGKASSWNFSYSYSYYAWVTNDFDDEDTDLMSFKRVSNSNYSSTEDLDSLAATGWYYITLDKDSSYILWGTCSNMVFVNVSSPSTQEYAFYTVEHTFDGTSSAPSTVEYTTEKTSTSASITFTIADSDIASYKVSTTGTTSSGESIDDVEESSNLGLMGSHTVSYTGLSRNTAYTFTITVTNSSGNSTDTTVSITTDNSYAPTNVTVAALYTEELYVTWEDDSDATDATYTVKVYEGDSSSDITESSTVVASVADIASGTEYALIRDLTVGTSYVAQVTATYNSTDYTASSSNSATVVKVTATTIKNHSTSAYIIPNTEGAVYCLSSSAANESYSATWIIHSALDKTLTYTYSGGNDTVTGTVNTFSLEATDASGNGTGKYLYITNLSTSNTSATDGTATLVDESSITSSEDYDATKASFFEAYSSWSNSDGSNNSSSMGYYISIRSTYSDGGFMLGNDTAGNVLKYRYSLNAAGVSNWHWYLDKSTTTSE